MKKILNILGISFLIAIAGAIYFKNTVKAQSPKIEYTRLFHTAYTVGRGSGTIVVLGGCNRVLSVFKVEKDTAFLQFEGKPVLAYLVLGIDSENGLHLLAADSSRVLVYKVYDPRSPGNLDSAGLQMKFSRGEILLYPSKRCF